MNAEAPDTFSRHPKLTIFIVMLVMTLILLLLAEVSLRIFGSVNIHYYTGYKTPGVHAYPYGDIPINQYSFPDEDFDLNDGKYRIGYFGDSVTYGVGAGYGYRVSDLLQKAFPDYDHWTFAYVGDALDRTDVVGRVTKFKVNTAIYLMNLNDILPDPAPADHPTATEPMISRLRHSVLGGMDEFLRGRSYLYTYIRLGLKNTMQKLGYEAHGMPAFELFPQANERVLDATVARVADAVQGLATDAHARACVVILPYEMQISQAAAANYEQLGFKWEQGFLQGSTQEALVAKFAQHGITAYDARAAFAGREFGKGEAFVYDKGDKIDWNHPNRVGHQVIAAWLQNNGDFVANCLRPPAPQP